MSVTVTVYESTVTVRGHLYEVTVDGLFPDGSKHPVHVQIPAWARLWQRLGGWVDIYTSWDAWRGKRSKVSIHAPWKPKRLPAE